MSTASKLIELSALALSTAIELKAEREINKQLRDENERLTKLLAACTCNGRTKWRRGA